VPVGEPALGRERLRVARGSAEPLVPVETLLRALPDDAAVEQARPLLPVGYAAGVDAYRSAVAALSAHDLTTHYTEGLDFFHGELVPKVKARLTALTGGAWSLDDHEAFAAGSDVDFMAHVVEAVAAREEVCIFPGDWHGFAVGCTHPEKIRWTEDARGRLACLCIPSVRNGHVTDDMLTSLEGASACLLNLNLLPTLAPDERHSVARRLAPVLGKSILSISFSRGFGLTASQLGVALVPRNHPYRERFGKSWSWFTYFYNAIAARAFMAIDHQRLEAVDEERRRWVWQWLEERSLPVVRSGSYYVKSFRVDGPVPGRLAPLARDGVVRLCLKPPQA
jgi:hypothetical protein